MPQDAQIPRESAQLPREAGGFRLLRTLGQGGMGIVYEAEELSSGRHVALKVLVKELTLPEEALERFRREARIAASISDPRCVFVFGAHQVQGSPAIAMELCPGETLEHRLTRREPIAIEDALRWTIEILDGLEAAHRVGVVHRDVKPSNCFITAEGRVKVGDFGLARLLEDDVQLTRSGVFLGSPLYASPEQVRGRQVDLRSDLYSVGATLYALLTGRSPYQGESLGEVLARILSETPEPPSRLRKEIPRALDKVVLRAMSREPSQRYQTHAEMREALRAFLGSSSAPAGRVRRFLAWVADVWILSLLNALVIALWTWFEPSAIQPDPGRPLHPYSAGLTVCLALLGLVYFAGGDGFFGRTIGKWITGQRVVLVVDSRRGVLLRMLRAVTWTFGGLLSMASLFFADDAPEWLRNGTAASGASMLWLLAMISTMRRKNGWRGVHELVSGTRVVAQPLPFVWLTREPSPLATTLEHSDLFPARLGAYATVGRVGRTPSGQIFEADDPLLDRRVWIHQRDAQAPPFPAERRALERATRLRWLDGFEEHGRRHEVLEAPGGARLVDCRAGQAGLPWPVAHGMLSALAKEIDDDPAPRISLDQLWLDRSWNLKVLDEPLGERASPALEPLELLTLAAHTSLGTDGGSGRELPVDLPGHAERSLRRLLGLEGAFTSVAEARLALNESEGRPQGLTRRIRGQQMLLGSGIWMFFGLVSILSTVVIVLPIALPQAREARLHAVLLKELDAGRRMTPQDMEEGSDAAPSGAEIDAQGLRARAIVLAEFLNRPRPPGQHVSLELSDLSAQEQALVARLKEEHVQTPSAEVAEARTRVDLELPRELPSNADTRILEGMPFFVVLGSSLMWAALALASAFLARGGLSLRMMSLAVRDARGRRAGRLRCAWRATLAALPCVAIYCIPTWLVVTGHPTLATAALVAAAILHAALIATSLSNPSRGWHDRLAGTRLVPR